MTQHSKPESWGPNNKWPRQSFWLTSTVRLIPSTKLEVSEPLEGNHKVGGPISIPNSQHNISRYHGCLSPLKKFPRLCIRDFIFRMKFQVFILRAHSEPTKLKLITPTSQWTPRWSTSLSHSEWAPWLCLVDGHLSWNPQDEFSRVKFLDRAPWNWSTKQRCWDWLTCSDSHRRSTQFAQIEPKYRPSEGVPRLGSQTDSSDLNLQIKLLFWNWDYQWQ